MRKNKLWIWGTVILAAVFLVLLFMPRDNQPSPQTRVILEHSHRTYIAPSCFEESNATNFLEEATLQEARDLNYPAESACTEKAFQGNSDSFLVSLLKELGAIEKESNDW
ncbi:hypothetical protein QWY14_15295 [Planococcus sp. N028]|uniref:Uncharacterized protein n=1 Tax=Planococcus shixiaomingii TaxID=3058393 RepID=A0ABT8N5L7_9BACL|nr:MULTISPECIES: hypothetical protein [unclassified Planococcus (in: firmicutes)]MDN7243168.1 hypothetical protein [Planococcus sp. N028]WKA55112.1 hypothetical protein QWY21_01660 [Planococcus sp. N022]